MLSVASEVSAKDENAVDEELKEKLSSTAAKVETQEDNNEESEAEEEEGDAAAGLGALFG